LTLDERSLSAWNTPMPDEGVILIADDEEHLLTMTAILFRRQGFLCDCSPDAASALAQLKKRRYDLPVSDLQMPGNADMSFIRKAETAAPGLPVILTTAFPTVDSAVQAVELPVVAYVVKPYQPDALLAQVRKATLVAAGGIARRWPRPGCPAPRRVRWHQQGASPGVC
jgi:DNA-binding NtrC family response regulator